MTALSHQPKTQAEFEEAMTARLRGMLGDMMPDEMLKKFLDDAIRKMFFVETVTQTRSSYSYEVKEERTPPYITRFIKEHVEKAIGDVTREWMAANKEEVVAAIRNTIEDGIAGAVVASFSRMWREPMMELENRMWEIARHAAKGA